MSLFSLLLRLFPASFRHEYGEELRAVFVQQRRTARGVQVPTLWLRSAADIAVQAAAAHLDLLRADVRSACRLWARTPGFAVTALLLVGLGIGATTAAFTIADRVLFRPLPFPDPDRLVKIWQTTPGYSRMEFSAPNYRDWKAAARSYASLSTFRRAEVTLDVGGDPRRVVGAAVSAEIFETLGVLPALGRAFTAADDRDDAPATVLLSESFWRVELGADPGVLGRTLRFGDTPHLVVGVMPRDFHFPRNDVRFWTPMRLDAAAYAESERTNNWLEVVGRLRPDATIAQARAEIAIVAARSAHQHPVANKDTGGTVIALRDEIPARSRLMLVALLGASACVLLIACANLANLLLARALSRRRELAVRTALGAGRERLVRQLLTESLLLAVTGGLLGVGIATASVPLLARLVPATLPLAETPAVDLRVLAFALFLTAVTGLAAGLMPLARSHAVPDTAGLRDGPRSGGGGRERLRAGLVVVEIVVSVVLLVSAGLLIRALLTVQRIDPGFDPQGVITLRAELPVPEYGPVAAREAFYAQVLDDIRAMPGVRAAGFISHLPMSGFRGGIWPVTVPGDPASAGEVRRADHVAAIRYVTPGFFAAMGMPLRRGRGVEPRDTREARFVAVVSESFVQRYWPGADPIGRTFTFAFAEREVVGVVADVRFRGLERTSEPQVYLASAQVADGAIVFYAPRALAVKTTGEPTALLADIRASIRRADPKLAVTEVQTLADLVALDTAPRAVQVRVLAGFGLVAFVLAAIGIHGLLAYVVAERTPEIGVRLALGAEPRNILSMLLRRSGALAAAGLLPGLVLAYAAGRSLESLLAGVRPADALTLAATAALVLVMAALGTLVPAVRALRVDPITALRTE